MQLRNAPFVRFKLRYWIFKILRNIDVPGFRFLSNILPRVLMPPAEGAVHIETLHGFHVWIDPVKDNGVEKNLYLTGTYEEGTLKIINRLLKKGDFFIDVGANIGLMTLAASHSIGDEGRVLAFEANPETFLILEYNVQLNSGSNIDLSNFAIGSSEKKGIIYDKWDKNRGSSTLIKSNGEDDFHEINVTTLDKFVKQKQTISLIKIDVEGYELEVLKGASRILNSENAPNLIIECSVNNFKDKEIAIECMYNIIMRTGNYKIYKTRGSKSRSDDLVLINSKDELPSHDNIYCISKYSEIVFN